MRFAVWVALTLLCACASEKLALAPPPGVDLSGHWRLNEADSDDPLRLAQSPDPSKVPSGGQPGGQGGQGGGGRQGRGGRGGGGGFGGPGGAGGPSGPAMPGMGAMGEGLRWPGREVVIQQSGGVVTMTSGGVSRLYQPAAFDKKHGRPHDKPPADAPRDRDMPSRDRGDGPPAHSGWDDRTLVIQGGEPDEDRPPFEERYNLSADGQRLIEVVGFKQGRSNGYTLSRVWDRAPPESPAPAASPLPPAH